MSGAGYASRGETRKVGELEEQVSLLHINAGETEKLLVALTSRLESVLQPATQGSPSPASVPPDPPLVPRADSVRGARKALMAANRQLQSLLDRLEL